MDVREAIYTDPLLSLLQKFFTTGALSREQKLEKFFNEETHSFEAPHPYTSRKLPYTSRGKWAHLEKEGESKATGFSSSLIVYVLHW